MGGESDILIIALDSQLGNDITFARITIKLISGSCFLSSLEIIPHENSYIYAIF